MLGEDDLIRLGERLDRASLGFGERHPIILANYRIVSLLIDKAHRATFHGGTQLTLRVLRQQTWILFARSLVQQHIRRCVTCVRHRAQSMHQQMATLPTSRVQPAAPFSVIGLDYAGPFLLTSHAARGQRTTKHYIAVFVCFATKAVHLKCVDDYCIAGFLAAFHRFVSRRGLPAHIHSDNGTNFQGADRELEQAWKSFHSNETLHAYFVNECIQ